MFQRIRSYCLSGIHAIPVSVEVDSSLGLPGFTLVGLPDSAVRESGGTCGFCCPRFWL